MKIIRLIIIAVLLPTFYSCDKQRGTYSTDCDFCFNDKPVEGELVIYFSAGHHPGKFAYRVYEGQIENKLLVYADTADSAIEYVLVPVGRYYSAEAEYIIANKTVVAVDGDKFSARYETEECTSPCWTFAGGYLDVRLKEGW